ncbi:PTS sugar transporter subunit IIA [Pseudorhodoferax sp. Leaf267]|uniref:PTS sugar transporter subunit IIA n=1 Tax=Pseudorhodoferax sp. Leaf267 TaxID=1736316 RepID=UPI0006FD2FED|nr:PTS sugar transporter subunit IIA [Pseudorhodoferax sp. Leaf267]KQP22696.1 PTS nitrogen regulatory IIA subunit [Pseudorhodoferax sp. Leaf267]
MGTLTDYLDERDILLDLHARDKRELFEAVGTHMEALHGVPAHAVATALQRRESAGTTALGCGVAIPHARVSGLRQIRIVYARLAPALDFETPDGQPVCDVVTLMVPTPASQAHLDVLAQVASLFSDAAFRAALHAGRSAAQIRRSFAQWTA